MANDKESGKNSNTGLTYRDAGVDIDAGNTLVERIKPLVKQTSRAGVLGGIGGFGGLFELPWQDYKAPVLVSGTDGVGTKLRLAIDSNRLDGIGIDLVAMCVNDIIVTGAEPLIFLDYYATGKLDVDTATRVVAGIAEGCRLAGAALSGGETAEMPGMYQPGDFDLAGFAVGIVEKDRIIDSSKIAPGDVIIGLGASGPHSNGYSLINAVLQDQNSKGNTDEIKDELLVPTRIYVQSVLAVLKAYPIHALAHITGGGLLENVPRVLPAGISAHLDSQNWQIPGCFGWLKQQGNIAAEEMYRVFNCGIGMVVIVAADKADAIREAFEQAGERANIIGTIESADDNAAQPTVIIDNIENFQYS